MKTWFIVDSQACTLDEIEADTPEEALRLFAEVLDEPLGDWVVVEEKVNCS